MSSTKPTPITVAHGDGIGPEIMAVTLRILEAAGANLAIETIEIGEKVYLRGVDTGIEASAWESLRRTRVFLKAPITTPFGGGYKSLNVAVRKALGLYANVRPCVSYAPFVPTKHPHMDVVIVRENEEDTYAGIEYQQTDEVTQCLKLISRPGSERIIRYAFEYARHYGRKKVTCLIKDNIMKLTDGMFAKMFERIAPLYPDIEAERMIVDIGTARLADTPTKFDVVVTLNLYGDIISDVTAQIAGSIGIAGSANIGLGCAMFEAVHGSAPLLAGQNKANPSALLQGAVLMLVHIGQTEVAQRIQNAWLCALEDGCHTQDIFHEGLSREHLGTHEFGEAVIARLGQMPKTLKPAHFGEAAVGGFAIPDLEQYPKSDKQLVGVDVFFDWDSSDRNPTLLGKQLEALAGPEFLLSHVSNRGITVYPAGLPETFCSDHWRARFLSSHKDTAVTHKAIVDLLSRICIAKLDFIQTEHLYSFDGVKGFSLI
ncbi:MAG TPA: NADP-dependent isocitrate dehydrogenase [Opitutales bacterium]|nr:NADP-dependent isocitrate dehydrogenase [Opitutales bacterium]